jgi:hypothetical protein
MWHQHKVMVGLKMNPNPNKGLVTLFLECKWILIRELMKYRLYHMNYNTSKQHKRFCIAAQCGRS